MDPGLRLHPVGRQSPRAGTSHSKWFSCLWIMRSLAWGCLEFRDLGIIPRDRTRGVCVLSTPAIWSRQENRTSVVKASTYQLGFHAGLRLARVAFVFLSGG